MPAGKSALKFALLGFVLFSIAAALYKAGGAGFSSAARPPAALVETAAGLKAAVVYYFYTDARCSSCKSLEAYTREAVASGLAAGYKDWRVEFRGVNVDDKENAHFVQDYRLDSKAVIVQKFSGGKALSWGKLEKVWTLLGDKDAFMAYVVSETHKLLDEK